MKRVPLRLVFLMAVLAAAFRIAAACSFPPPNAVTKYKWSTNIASLKVLSVEYSPGGIEDPDTGRAVLRVEKVFKGDLKPGQELVFYAGRISTCTSHRFSHEDIGAEMLFYLGAGPTHDGLWEANGEMMGSMQPGSADLFYIENFGKYRGRSLFFGRVSQESYSGDGDQFFRRHPVTITGDGKTYKTKTDKNGIYKLADLPPGMYKLKPGKAPGFKAGGLDYLVFEIKAGDHLQKDIGLTIDNTVSGRVADASGAVLDRTVVYLVPAEDGPPPDFPESTSSDASGAFTFTGVSAGRYILAVNYVGSEPTLKAPFHTFYYPGTFKREAAMEITVGRGTELADLDLRSPETLSLINIRGTLVNDAGEPIPEGLVWFFEDRGTPDADEPDEPDDDFGDSSLFAKTDESGQFVFTLAKGRKGWIRSSYPVWKASQEGCPKMLAKFAGLGTEDLKPVSEKVSFEGDRDVSGIELKFPYPVCRRVVKPSTFQMVERAQ